MKRAFQSLLPIENLAGHMIVRSNQGTGAHLTEEISLDASRAFSSGKVIGIVVSIPHPEIGGHVFFSLKNSSGEITCACYEPTAEFRKNVSNLLPGDLIEVGGGVRKATSLHSKVLNLEYLRPLKLKPQVKRSNPKCPNCQSGTSSQGRDQGFRCKRCGFVLKENKKVEELQRRVSRHDYTFHPSRLIGT